MEKMKTSELENYLKNSTNQLKDYDILINDISNYIKFTRKDIERLSELQNEGLNKCCDYTEYIVLGNVVNALDKILKNHNHKVN
jgi:hypothetical protein